MLRRIAADEGRPPNDRGAAGWMRAQGLRAFQQERESVSTHPVDHFTSELVGLSFTPSLVLS